MARLTFDHHPRALGRNRFVYAVLSRRSGGLSVGVNLNPDKACNFACPYCQVDRKAPGGEREVAPAVVEAELRQLLGLVASGELWALPPFDSAPPAFRRCTDVAFAGDGEPTTCRVFPEVVDLVVRLRREHSLEGVGQVLLTNATRFHVPRVQRAIDAHVAGGGAVWAKLDAGTEEGHRLANASALPYGVLLHRLLLGARRWPLLLQALFFSWEGRPPAEAEVEAWAGRIRWLRDQGGEVREVHVTTIARAPADSRVGRLELGVLEAIAARAREAGVAVRVVA